MLDVIKEGRKVKVGDWLEIGERTSIGELSDFTDPDLSKSLDISIDSVGGYEEFVEKGSEQLMNQVKARLQQRGTQRIDVLVISSDKYYAGKLVIEYIKSLGIRFVVFQKNGLFDGWIDASSFSPQISPYEDYPYSKLRDEIVGVTDASASSGETAIEVLRKMESLKVNSIAIVEDQKFRFITDRVSILSKLITRALVKDR